MENLNLNAEFLKIERDYREKCGNLIKGELVKIFKPIFESIPELETISWTQYTPYFNDGDDCIFTIHSDIPYLNGRDDYGDYIYSENDLESEDDLGSDISDKLTKDDFERVSKLIRSLPEKLIEISFGEGLAVIYKNGSYTTLEYEHD